MQSQLCGTKLLVNEAANKVKEEAKKAKEEAKTVVKLQERLAKSGKVSLATTCL